MGKYANMYNSTHSLTPIINLINPLTSNDPYRGRKAPLTPKVAFYIFIQQIYVLNILNMVYILRFSFSKCSFVS